MTNPVLLLSLVAALSGAVSPDSGEPIRQSDQPAVVGSDEAIVTDVTASAEECDRCNNHWWFTEHAHCSLGGYTDNVQNHPCDYLAGDCDQHGDCFPEEDNPLETAARLVDDLVVTRPSASAALSVMKRTVASGVSMEVVSVGIELSATCPTSGARLSLTVPAEQGTALALVALRESTVLVGDALN
jgi:hypothetical protein